MILKIAHRLSCCAGHCFNCPFDPPYKFLNKALQPGYIGLDPKTLEPLIPMMTPEEVTQSKLGDVLAWCGSGETEELIVCVGFDKEAEPLWVRAMEAHVSPVAVTKLAALSRLRKVVRREL